MEPCHLQLPQLSEDIWEQVFEYLDASEWGRAARTCKMFSNMQIDSVCVPAGQSYKSMCSPCSATLQMSVVHTWLVVIMSS